MNESLLTQIKTLVSILEAPSDFLSFAKTCAKVFEGIGPDYSSNDLYAVAEILNSDKTS